MPLDEIPLARSGLDRAKEQFEMAIKIMPNFPEAHANLGILYYHTEQFDLSLKELELAISLDERLLKARYFLSIVYYYLGRMDDADAELDFIVGVNPFLCF